jgi:ribonuclease J
LTAIGDEGVLALVCDSTNVFNPSPSGSEGDVARAMKEEVARHKGKRVLVTTLPAMSRACTRWARWPRQPIAALRLGPFAGSDHSGGRGLRLSGQIARYYRSDTAMSLPRGEVLIVATGGQGEPRAALARIAEGNHPIKLDRATLSFLQPSDPRQ